MGRLSVRLGETELVNLARMFNLFKTVGGHIPTIWHDGVVGSALFPGVVCDPREIPSTSLRAGSSLRLKSGCAQDDAAVLAVGVRRGWECDARLLHQNFAMEVL